MIGACNIQLVQLWFNWSRFVEAYSSHIKACLASPNWLYNALSAVAQRVRGRRGGTDDVV